MSSNVIKGATFLVADDEEFIRSLIKQLLLEMGAQEVLVADQGRKAIELLEHRSGDVDCIVSDFKMPTMTGVEFLQSVRSGTAHVDRDLPFAMLTGYTDKFVIGLAMALDIDAFIAKPVSKTVLASRVAPLLTRERQILLPAKNYARLGLSSTVSDLEDRVATLEQNIREQAKAVQKRRDGTAAEDRAPVWTPKSAPETRKSASEVSPSGAADRQAASAMRQGSSIAVTLETAPEGAVLAIDVHTKAGNLVLAAGTMLNERILDKLHHIQDLGEDFGVIHILE